MSTTIVSNPVFREPSVLFEKTNLKLSSRSLDLSSAATGLAYFKGRLVARLFVAAAGMPILPLKTNHSPEEWRDLLSNELKSTHSPTEVELDGATLRVRNTAPKEFPFARSEKNLLLFKQSNIVVFPPWYLYLLSDAEVDFTLAHEIAHYITASVFHSAEAFRFLVQWRTSNGRLSPSIASDSQHEDVDFEDLVNWESFFSPRTRVYGTATQNDQKLIPLSFLRFHRGYLTGVNVSDKKCAALKKQLSNIRGHNHERIDVAVEQEHLSQMRTHYLKCRGEKKFGLFGELVLKRHLRKNLPKEFHKRIAQLRINEQLPENVIDAVFALEAEAATTLLSQYDDLDAKQLAFYSYEQAADELSIFTLHKMGVSMGAALTGLIKLAASTGAEESLPGRSIPLHECLKIAEQPQLGEMVLVGDQSDAYHSYCYRLLSMLTQMRSLGYQTFSREEVSQAFNESYLGSEQIKEIKSQASKERIQSYEQQLAEILKRE